MEFTHSLTLIEKELTQDEIGNITATEKENEVLCRQNIVGTREFYNAMMVGMRPTAELQIRSCEYNGEQECEFNGERLAIIRVIPKSKFDLVLVVGQKQGVNVQTGGDLI